MREPRYRNSIIFIILIGVLAYLPSFFLLKHFYSDSYCYLTLAKGLRNLSYSLLFHRHLKYLPFYPISIFLVNSLTLGQLGFLYSAKLVSMFSLIASSCLVFDFCLLQTRSYRLSLLAGLLMVFSPIAVWMSGNVLTEPLFCCLGFASMVFLFREKNYLAWIFAGLALMTRYEGVFLVPALILAQWKKPKQLFIGILIFLFICAPWTYFIWSHLGEFFAYSYFQDLLVQNRTGLYFFVDLFLCLTPFLFALSLFGFSLYPKTLRLGVIIYLIGYSLIHIYWAWRAIRFTLPLVPFFTVSAVLAIQFLLKKLEKTSLTKMRTQRLSAWALGLILIPLIASSGYAYFSLGKVKKDLRISAVKSILEYDPNAVVLTNIEPHLCEWYGLKHSLPWHGFADKDPYQHIVRNYLENQARYLIWSKNDDYPLPFFNELVQKGYVTKKVFYQQQSYLLTFYSIYFLDNGNLIIFSLDLKPAQEEEK